MFLEIMFIACAMGIVSVLISRGNGIWLFVSIMCIIAAFGGACGFALSWQHETKVITIDDKFTTSNGMIVVGDGVPYNVIEMIDYSNMKVGKEYTVDVATNFDAVNVPDARYFCNIDRVVT